MPLINTIQTNGLVKVKVNFVTNCDDHKGIILLVTIDTYISSTMRGLYID